jgi:hypothetical protein
MGFLLGLCVSILVTGIGLIAIWLQLQNEMDRNARMAEHR